MLTNMDHRRKRILVVGPVPPPFHGVATFTRDLLEFGRHPDFELLHLDTSDRRDAGNIGKWDVQNVQLGFSNVAQLAASNLKSNIDYVYIPISQNVPAFLRDTLFILQSRMMLKKVVLHLHGGYFREFYDAAPAQQAGQSLIRSVMNSAAARSGTPFSTTKILSSGTMPFRIGLNSFASTTTAAAEFITERISDCPACWAGAAS
jgi:hypothetical protein